MTIEVRQLRYAVLTADTRSFSRAATALNMWIGVQKGPR